MRKFIFELPKYRLQVQMRLVKRRKPLVSEPLVPTAAIIRKKYRKGSVLGKAVRHISEHKSARKVFAANMAALVIAGTLLPTSQAQTIQEYSPLDTAEESVIQVENSLSTIRAIQYPLTDLRVNQSYGLFHPGLDLGAKKGTPIRPIKTGIVTESGYSTDGYGNTVLIDHGRGMTSRYAHLDTIEVNKGDKVSTIDQIGTVGSTGHSTGPHLHLEIRQSGAPLNPFSVLPR